MAEVAYLSLGSNLGDREAHLREAISRLKTTGSVRALSSFYETQPVELTNQPWFLNCVLALETEQTPRDLLKSALSIEAGMGRMRLRDKGPRNIDIDVLLFGDRIVDEPGLKIPHPALCARRFVLAPLAEIAPGVRHPVLGKTTAELLAGLAEGQVVRRI